MLYYTVYYIIHYLIHYSMSYIYIVYLIWTYFGQYGNRVVQWIKHKFELTVKTAVNWSSGLQFDNTISSA